MSLFGQGQTQGQNPLLAQVEAAYRRRLAGQQIGLVRGRHLIDWVPTVKELLRDGEENEALTLLLEMIEAAEQLARIDGAAPASTYTEQALAIYRSRGDDEGQYALLERYVDACPPGGGDPALRRQWDDLRR
jgi:hypothetical protein